MLNKAILATWDEIMTHSPEEMVPMVQAALLGQTFGLLSGEPKHMLIVDAFHGTVISWARRNKMFQARHSPHTYASLALVDCQDAWRRWSKTEEIIRLVAALHIHDAEIASVLHHAPLLRRAAVDLAKPAPDQLFYKNSREWYAQTRESISPITQPKSRMTGGSPKVICDTRTPHSSSLSAFADLEGILAAISEKKHSDSLDEVAQRRLTNELLEFRGRHLALRSADVDSFSLHILWHLCFMSLVTDFDLLERAIGRDGQQIDAAERDRVGVWAASQNAPRSKAHMQQIVQHLEAFPIGLEPTIHVPRAAFTVAISWYCCFYYMPTNEDRQPTPVEHAELKALGLDPDVWSRVNGDSALEVKDVLRRLSDLLQRLGHWEIARKFAAIIKSYHDPHSWLKGCAEVLVAVVTPPPALRDLYMQRRRTCLHGQR
ncbi:hypothetical protein LTR17_025024 [Elasticomyces elasticus]|nr:hypothetical protein LTR17_025024 [Elasticomyces elasticus]